MKKTIVLLLAHCLGGLKISAQAPKWMEKAKKAVFSVITYDAEDKILNTGNGFFVTENGVALSDYALFRGAHRAVIINFEGKQMPVSTIMGANEMYDVVKFKVGIADKKVPALALAKVAPAFGTQAYLLPYSTRKDRTFTSGKVSAVDKIEGQYGYYTLQMRLKEKMVSCPMVTPEGEVFALAQKSSGQDTATICYGMDAAYAMRQSISPLSLGDAALRQIGIRKALPDTVEQALVYLYMASSQLSKEEYMALINDFIAQYPDNADGYMHRARQRIAMAQDEAALQGAQADMEEALRVASKKDDIYFGRAKLIYSYRIANLKSENQTWTFEQALKDVRQANELNPMPIYKLTEGDIAFASTDYDTAFKCYDEVNRTDLASPASFFSAARSKEMLKASSDEVLALMDSCVSRLGQPYTEQAAPYLLERARMRMEADKARLALADYDDYYKSLNGKVTDVFYYYREQAALKARQYQRALNDMAEAIRLNPQDLTYRAELAVVNIRVGRYETAIEVLREALKVDAQYAEAYRLMGIAQVQLKQKEEACASFTKAKALGDTHVDELIQKHCGSK